MTGTLTRNVTRVYRSASPDALERGRAWYADAHALALELDPTDVARGAGVIAALSPRLTWTGNVNAARRAYVLARNPLMSREAFALAVPTLKGNALKAWRILQGESPLDVLGGDKVRSFYACILAAGQTDAVCVDMHAHDIAAGRVTDDVTRARTLERKGGYQSIADAYRRAARILSREEGRPIHAAEVQAVTWCAWRDTTHAAHRSDVRRAVARRRREVAA